MNQELQSIGMRACAVKYTLGTLSKEVKNRTLLAVADKLLVSTPAILEANQKDLANGEKKGLNKGLLDRLCLTAERIAGIAEGVRQVAALPDPVGELLDEYTAENGLHIKKVRVPMGVIGIIYEARPNVTVDAFALCFKTGNAVILKGGSDAIFSNIALGTVIREALSQCALPADALLLVTDTDRAVTQELMKMKDYVDLLIPRGGAGLIRSVVENSTVPVIETGTGNCHIFVDESADLARAVEIVVNAKTQRIGVCNACESLVVHRSIRSVFLPMLSEALLPKNVELRGDAETAQVISCTPATEEDFGTEYLDLILSVKTVGSTEEAIAHINRYTTHHSESILTENKENAERFLNEVDAACVYVNCSTRFTDGFEFGLGAEIGISTQKLHARGPMGLKELTSYKYEITGDYLVRK